ncbi:MAG TPA: serine/threonine-protein kinase, partial [Isosphaeraceae bacterium]
MSSPTDRTGITRASSSGEPAPGAPGRTGSGLQIPGYETLGRIGQGAMGVVYKARQKSVDRVVAIKVLRDDAARDREYIERFRREARVAAKLSHANIVAVIDAGEADGRHYFVMEYVEGTTVQDELDQGKVYDEKAALGIVLAVARALKHAHKRGLIHRDIKPANVILTQDGNIKLADLGLARMAAEAQGTAAEAGLAAGTPYYMSPEQARGQADVDIRSDLYSLGATFYHMVTGRVPYSGATPQEVMRQHVSKKAQLVPPDHINAGLSSGVGEVVETMMAKD